MKAFIIVKSYVSTSVKKPKNPCHILEQEKFETIGLPKNKFGLHSLRSGGATTAANAGIPDRLFKKHGRWRSEKAKDGYVKHSIKILLYVSSKLGILIQFVLLLSLPKLPALW